MEMEQKLLEVRDLSIIYKTDVETVYAVNNVSFSMKQGETLGIVGETGAGKTTTALAIMKLLPERTGRVVEGSIEFENIDIVNASEREMRELRGDKISMIFQDPMTSLNPVLTVGEQIRETLLLHGKGHHSKKMMDEMVVDTLKLVGISPERRNDYPHQFSGGMKQRVVIAIALACNPDLLIADEPTTALDVTIQAQVLRMMAELKQKLNMAMIMITHDLGIVAQTCDRVAIMYAGSIVEYGTDVEIFQSGKHHPYTEGLFASIPKIKAKTTRLSPIAGLMPDPTDLPKGCAFAPRCPHCMDICKEKKPPAYRDGEHQINCFLFSGTDVEE